MTTNLQMAEVADPVHLPIGRSGTALPPEAWGTCNSSVTASNALIGHGWFSHADVVLANKGGKQASKCSSRPTTSVSSTDDIAPSTCAQHLPNNPVSSPDISVTTALVQK